MSSGNKRIKGLSIARPFYYGSVAIPLNGKKASDADHTHKWTVMVKGLNNEDLSYYIKKVVFKLHETYPNPLRSTTLETMIQPRERESDCFLY